MFPITALEEEQPFGTEFPREHSHQGICHMEVVVNRIRKMINADGALQQ